MRHEPRQMHAGDIGMAPPPKMHPIICMLRHEFDALPEYSGTYPSGAIPGKTWRRHDGIFDRSCKKPEWFVCRYSEAFIDPKDGHEKCRVEWYRPILSRDAIAADFGIPENTEIALVSLLRTMSAFQ